MPHLQQIYTGFASLARQGIVQLRQSILLAATIDPTLEPHLQDSAQARLRARIGGVDVAFDVHDSGVIDEALLSSVQYYFKRSWELTAVQVCTAPAKVIPLGPNVWVHARAFDMFALQRARMHGPAHALKATLRACGLDRLLGDSLYTPRVPDLCAPPSLDATPRILFLAEAWNPAEAPSAVAAHERVEINALRAQCMRALRSTFGTSTTCGFRATDFSRATFPDLVVQDRHLTKKRHYLQQVREHPICIATTGLHRSIGWKFAEYLAMGRAIVSENLCMKLPEPMAAESHFLEFSTAKECVDQVTRIVNDRALRRNLMATSARYYAEHVEPSALVGAAIGAALRIPNPALAKTHHENENAQLNSRAFR